MKIKQLSPITISRIAAGEVIERPASVIKELVENSIDAGATRIEILFHQAGTSLISIRDNGYGMGKEDLAISVNKHTTSKLDEQNLMDIKYNGFRGEALASVCSISRVIITSRERNSDIAWKLKIEGGEKFDIEPASLDIGTVIEVRDLFYATPARLKFLKSNQTEVKYIIDMVNKLAMANPAISFTVSNENKNLLKFQATDLIENNLKNRIEEVLGKEFIDNSIELNIKKDDISIKGFISVPTYNSSTTTEQYLFVNNRPVRDKLLLHALKIAYQDFIPHDRHAIGVLFLDLPAEELDVNVHPTKAEVRFRNSDRIRSTLIEVIKTYLKRYGNQVSNTLSDDILSKMLNSSNPTYSSERNYEPVLSVNIAEKKLNNYQSTAYRSYAPIQNKINNLFNSVPIQPTSRNFEQKEEIKQELQEFPLGAACCQLHETYIIAQAKDKIIIIDQHAAHERIVYEKMKNQYSDEKIAKQKLLIPEIIELSNKRLTNILNNRENLSLLGIIINQCAEDAIIVTELPELIKHCNVKQLITDISDDIEEYGENVTFTKIKEHILETIACHSSIRSGKILSIDEMNRLLRQIESTPHSGQCNHGRPTYIELKLLDIEKLFGRR